MRAWEARGAVPSVAVPDTDEAIAKAVLHEAVKIALGPATSARRWRR
jgi:hypothetical protein